MHQPREKNYADCHKYNYISYCLGVPVENDDAAFDGYDHLANKDKSSDEHLSLYYNDVAFSPGFMKEEDVYNFAGQIACGLKHLHDMNVGIDDTFTCTFVSLFVCLFVCWV